VRTPIAGNSNEPHQRVRNQRRQLAPADEGPRGEWIWQRLSGGVTAAARLLRQQSPSHRRSGGTRIAAATTYWDWRVTPQSSVTLHTGRPKFKFKIVFAVAEITRLPAICSTILSYHIIARMYFYCHRRRWCCCSVDSSSPHWFCSRVDLSIYLNIGARARARLHLAKQKVKALRNDGGGNVVLQ